MSRDPAFEAAHDAWEHRTLSDYLDQPESYEWTGPAPVTLIPGDNDYLFREAKTGRYITAQKAVEIMEQLGYQGWELGEAKITLEGQK